MSLATITTLVTDKLRTAALGTSLAHPLGVQRAIDQAVLQYSLDAPQQLQVVVTGANGDTLAAPAGWVGGSSTLQWVEHPVGRAPRVTLEALATQDAAAAWQILLLVDSLVDATVRIAFTAPHVLTTEACTVPAHHHNAMACWAAAELCRQLATQKGHERDATINAVATNGSSQSGDLARRARDWDLQYRRALGLPDPDVQPGGNAASATVQWSRDRTRGRLHSLGY